MASVKFGHGTGGTFGTPSKEGVSRLSRLTFTVWRDIAGNLSRLSRLSRWGSK